MPVWHTNSWSAQLMGQQVSCPATDDRHWPGWNLLKLDSTPPVAYGMQVCKELQCCRVKFTDLEKTHAELQRHSTLIQADHAAAVKGLHRAAKEAEDAAANAVAQLTAKLAAVAAEGAEKCAEVQAKADQERATEIAQVVMESLIMIQQRSYL